MNLLSAQELRIGNFVLINRGDKMGDDWILERVTGYELSHATEKRGVPLTKAVLKKCGFENDNGDLQQHFSLFLNIPGRISVVYYEGDSSCLSIMQDDKIIDFPASLHKYLHQLQNFIFAFTNQELPVKDLVPEDYNPVNVSA